NANGNITLDNANNFSTVAVTSGANVILNDSNTIDLGASSITGTLGVTAVGAITDSGALSVTGGTTLNANGNITLDNANNFSTVAVTSGANVTLNDSDTIDLGASSITGTLGVTAVGEITDSGALSVTGGTTLNANSNIILDNANNFSTVAVTSGANVTLNDSNAINLGASTITGTLDVTAGGAITDNDTLSVANGTTTLNANGNDITLNNANNFSTVAVTNSRNVTLNDTNAIDLGASTITGTLDVTAGGAITDSGNLSVAGVTTLNANGNDITLNNGNNFSAVAVTSGRNVTLNDTNAIDLGASSITGNLGVSANGAITGIGNLSVAGVTTLNANGNDITLNNGNNFSTVAVTSGRNVTLNDINAIELGASSITGNLGVTATDVNINGTVTAANATFEPTSPTSTIGIGDSATGTFNLNATDLSNLQSNGTVTIGSDSFTGDISINDVNLSGETFNLTVQGGNPTFTGILNLPKNLNVTATTGNITQTSGGITVSGVATLKTGISNDITLNDANNNFNEVIITSARDVTLNDTDNILLRDSTISRNLNLTSKEDTVLGTASISGNLNMTSNGGEISQNTPNDTLTVNGTATLAAGTNQAITLNNTNNNFNEVVITKARDVTLNDTDNILLRDSTISRHLNLTSKEDTVLGTASISGNLNVTSNGGEIRQNTSNDTLTVNGTATLAAGTNKAITLNNTNNNFNSVAVSQGNNVTLKDINNLNLNSTSVSGILEVAGATISTNGVINAGAVNLTGDNGITLNGKIQTSDIVDNNVTLNGAVTLGANATIDTDNVNNDGIISINQSINGDRNLTLNAGSGSINVGQAIGSTTGLSNLTLKAREITLSSIGGGVISQGVSGAATLDATEAINFTGTTYNAQNQNYTAGTAFNLDNTTTFRSNGGAIAFNTGTIQGTNPADLTLDAGTGRVTVGAIGNGNEINNLTIRGSSGITLNGNITTSDAPNNTINLNSPVTLGNTITLTNKGGAINFNSPVDGTTPNSQDLTVEADNNSTVVFAGAVGNSTSLRNLTVNNGESLTFNNRVTVTENINLTADEIDFKGGANSVSTPNQGTISLKPSTDSVSIDIGSPPNGQGTLDISDTDLAAIANGFSQIKIGRGTDNGEMGNGTIVIDAGGVSFQDPVTIQSPAAGGRINVNGNLTGTDNASITINGADVYLGNQDKPQVEITTEGHDIVIGQNVHLHSDLVEVKTGAEGGDITFTGDVDGRTAEEQSLTVAPGTGNVSFEGEIGQDVPLKQLRIGDDTTINADIVGTSTTIFNSLFVNAQQSRVAGTIKTRGGPIEFTGDVILVTDTTFDTISEASPGARGGDVIFGATVSSSKENNQSSTSPFDLNIRTGSGTVTFGGTVGAQDFGGGFTTTDLGSLTIGSAGEVKAVLDDGVSLPFTITTVAPETLPEDAPKGISILADSIDFSNANLESEIVNLEATENIRTASVTATQEDITLNSKTGSIDTSNGTLTATQGNVNLTASQGDITTADIEVTEGVVDLTANQGSVTTANVEAPTVNIQANKNINTASVTATQEDITFNSQTGSIDTTKGTLTATQGDVNLRASQGDITTADIEVTEGVVDLTATQGSVTTA
ncbi:beta strand repeat-containing protein, partial [Coleofasciculus sp.]|uniref:beta strand repeat-containing protein n=1 Tax=Coleofasciculus sp. TaxID=3100458 RepID=UPI0039F95138